MLIDPQASAEVHQFEEPVAAQAAELRLIKSRFLASLNHQIRTPMSGILGMIDLLMETPLDPDQKEYVVATRICAQELFDLLSASLDFSALAEDAVPLKDSEFDVTDMLESCLADYALQAENKGLDLFTDISLDLPQTAIGDPTRLRQMLAQLLNNAIKFTIQGHVELRARAALIRAEQFVLEAEVRDSGPGMSPAEIQALVTGRREPGSAGSSGLGIGLALCRRLANLMGGHLEASSTLGEGSVFRVAIPLRLAAVPGRTDWNMGLAGRRALVLNTRPAVSRSMAALLGQFGLRVTEAESIDETRRIIDLQAASGDPLWVVLFEPEHLSGDAGSVVSALRTGYADPFFVSMVWPSRTQRIASSGAADAELLKPVRRYILYDTLLGLLARQARPESGPRSVLVTEDNLVSQRLVAHVLRRGGYLVETANSGAASIRAVQEKSGRPYDLILMDLQMPGIDGLEATDEIRRLPQGARVPIVALTADTSEEMRTLCREHGMNGYLVKPIRSEELLSAVARCLE